MSENEACLLKSPTRTPWNKGKFGRGGVRVDLIDAALRWHWEGALSACPGSGAKINSDPTSALVAGIHVLSFGISRRAQ
jgi:hypothetical protein